MTSKTELDFDPSLDVVELWRDGVILHCTAPVDEVRETLRDHILENYGTQKEAAIAWGHSTSFVCDVLHGRRHPSETMLDAIGVKRVQMYLADPE